MSGIRALVIAAGGVCVLIGCLVTSGLAKDISMVCSFDVGIVEQESNRGNIRNTIILFMERAAFVFTRFECAG